MMKGASNFDKLCHQVFDGKNDGTNYLALETDMRRTRRMAELKPCPFCGGEAVVTKHHNRFIDWYLCSCPKCHISQTGSEYGFRFEAIEAWNRRADDGRKATD